MRETYRRTMGTVPSISRLSHFRLRRSWMTKPVRHYVMPAITRTTKPRPARRVPPWKVRVDFRSLCPILQQLLSNYRGAPRLLPFLAEY
jgi:hypothetical protein